MALGIGLGLSFSKIASSVTPTLPAPRNFTLPIIDNTSPEVGDTLTTTNGTWGNSPTSFSYQWQVDGFDIDGATTNSYIPVEDDIGRVLSSKVTATNATGSTQATSLPTNAVTDLTPTGDWILATGDWDDTGVWDDTAVWID